MAKYANSPIACFLGMTMEEFMDWMGLINAEIERENMAMGEKK